ncbi:MAG: sigma-70 family RNA polymerase sigma factor, partial [Acidobacteriota bacterium]|nr:sigma-70 family RNA polymerase sigma factor [Acidobacteriota bacterium]
AFSPCGRNLIVVPSLSYLENTGAKIGLKVMQQEAGDRQLVEAAQRDPARFADLYERNFDRVYAFIARRVSIRAEAEDLTADVFHHALANLGRFEWRGVPFLAWLLRIARNAMADRWQRAGREQLDPAPEASVDSDQVQEAEEAVKLSALVEQLPADQRRVVLLRFAGEKSIREIARELGRSEGAVKQLQFRALENLRARLGGKHG